MIPTSLFRVAKRENEWVQKYKGRTLAEELGFDIDTAAAANGWEVTLNDDFDGTPVGQRPANISREADPSTGAGHWWSYGRGPTGSGGPVEPGFTRPDFSTDQYQILAPSVLGIGAVRLPAIPGHNGAFLTGSMQTQRRGPNKIPVLDGSWSYEDNLSFDQSWGYFEHCMKADRFSGAWPGGWMISSDEYAAPEYPRIEIDINELYLSSTSEDGILHNCAFLHKSNGVARFAPGWLMVDRGWSNVSAPGLDCTVRYPDGTLKKWDDGFHQFGVLMSHDVTAPGGLGWWIWYCDRVELNRLPLLAEDIRHYYFILSHQTQDPYQQQMAYFDQQWLEVDYVRCWRNNNVPEPPRLTKYVRPTLTLPTRTISIGRLERHLGLKANVPINGSVPTAEHSDAAVTPQMAQSTRFTVVVGRAGTIGTVAVTNTPSDPVRYRLTGEGHEDFTIDSATGEVSAPSALDTVRRYDLAVTAWPSPLRPMLAGTNATRVVVDVKEDQLFDWSYWDQIGVAVPKLRAWIDAQSEPHRMVTAAGKVQQITDRSSKGIRWNQNDPLKQPTFNPGGINGLPAFEGMNSAVRMTGAQIITSSALTNLVVRTLGALSVGPGGTTVNGAIAAGQPFSFVMAWDANPATNPDAVYGWVNGSPVGVTAQSPINKPYTILIGAVLKAKVIPTSNQLVLNGADLFTNNTASGWFNGLLGELGVLYDPGNVGFMPMVNKLIGGLHWKWGMTDRLPADFPYKTIAPKLWE